MEATLTPGSYHIDIGVWWTGADSANMGAQLYRNGAFVENLAKGEGSRFIAHSIYDITVTSNETFSPRVRKTGGTSFCFLEMTITAV